MRPLICGVSSNTESGKIMDPIQEKRDAYQKARLLLDKNDDQLLSYAVLELRRCIEAVVYEKLWTYRDRIPLDAAKRWQPPQAFKALLLMEPDAASTAIIRIAKQEDIGKQATGNYETLGIDERPNTGWLNKTYNKIGSFLHASWPFSQKVSNKEPGELRSYLEKVATDLEPFVKKSFTCTLARLITFECSVCGLSIKANATGLEQVGEVFCINPECDSRYFVTKEGENFLFSLDACSAKCQECQTIITLPRQKLHIGHEFSCPNCKSQYEIYERVWEIKKKLGKDC